MGILEDIFSAAFRGEKSPEIPRWVEWKHRSMGITHCDTCLKLDKGWFMEENKPQIPQHFLCHCVTVEIPFSRVLSEAASECVISKIDPYLFDPKGNYSHGKEKLFQSWGYCVADAKWLQSELITQGLDKYINGQYTLGLLNEQGQRIRIRVEIPRKDREGLVSFETGWLVEPQGHIRLVTPYADN